MHQHIYTEGGLCIYTIDPICRTVSLQFGVDCCLEFGDVLKLYLDSYIHSSHVILPYFTPLSLIWSQLFSMPRDARRNITQGIRIFDSIAGMFPSVSKLSKFLFLCNVYWLKTLLDLFETSYGAALWLNACEGGRQGEHNHTLHNIGNTEPCSRLCRSPQSVTGRDTCHMTVWLATCCDWR